MSALRKPFDAVCVGTPRRGAAFIGIAGACISAATRRHGRVRIRSGARTTSARTRRTTPASAARRDVFTPAAAERRRIGAVRRITGLGATGSVLIAASGEQQRDAECSA